MLNRLCIPLLCLVLLLQPVHDLLIVLQYVINKEFFATVLCINRDKPELGCAGKCQVTEQLKEKEKKKNDQKGLASEKIDLQLYLPVSIERPQPPDKSEEHDLRHPAALPHAPPRSIFHPPRISADNPYAAG
jgi:hypothetical protein